MAAHKQDEEVEPIAFSMAQTAKRLGIGLTTLYQEVNRGELETFVIGDRRLTTDDMQRAYIERKRQRARAG